MKQILFLLLVLGPASTLAQSERFVWVFLNTNPHRAELPKAEVDSLQAGHMRNIQRLAAEGDLLAAGPFEGGGGIFVFRSTTTDSVRDWLRTDPAIRAGRFVLEVFPYLPRVGSIRSVGKTYVMTMYHTVRFPATSGADADLRLANIVRSTSAADTLIAAGTFGADGGFAVFRTPIEPGRFKRLSPADSASVLVRDLYIARGSFGEPR